MVKLLLSEEFQIVGAIDFDRARVEKEMANNGSSSVAIVQENEGRESDQTVKRNGEMEKKN